MKIDITAMIKAMAAVLGLVTSSGVLAGENGTTGFVMTFFAESAQGAAVEDGAYEDVIAKLTRKNARGARRVADQVNLCVAYTKTKQLDKAIAACDEALAMAGERAIRPNSVGFYHADKVRMKEERAVALVNRGVLHAVAGDDVIARQMFEMANDLDVEIEAATQNLSVLQQGMSERDT